MRLCPTLFIAAPLMLLASPAMSWTVDSASGSVTAQGQAEAPAPGATLTPGTSVSTGRDGRLVLRQGGSVVTLSANGRVRVPAKTDLEPASLVAERGSTLVDLDASAGAAETIATPYLRARASDAAFSIAVNGSGATLQVKEGAAEVSTLDGGAVRTLKAGTIGLVAAEERYRLIIDGAARGIVESRFAPRADAGEGPRVSTDGAAVVIASAR